MKIIDKTPLVDAKGQLSFTQRLQGMMQFGFNWPNELQTQKAIIAFFDRQLEKGFTLIRNYTLGQSGILVPIILIGPTGMYVIQIANERGRFQINGEKWNVASGEGYKPAPVNLVQDTMRKARAVKQWIERQGTKVPVNIEPVLIAGDPGLHIESVNPAIKTLMIDGIKSYVMGLAGGATVLSNDRIFELTERIINPRPPKKMEAPEPLPHEDPFYTPSQEFSGTRATFDDSQPAKPFSTSDFDFAMQDEPAFDVPSAESSVQEASPDQPLPSPKPQTRRVLGMTPGQLALVAVLGVVALCLFAVLGYLVLF